jgi:putative ABC transport system permease protein
MTGGEERRVIQDLRYALRQLGKHPGFAAVAVITLALGTGANGAIFSVVDTYLLRALPYPHADRQVVVNDVQPSFGEAPASFLEWQDLKESGRMFEALAASFPRKAPRGPCGAHGGVAR